jgi:hypothetical protein
MSDIVREAECKEIIETKEILRRAFGLFQLAMENSMALVTERLEKARGLILEGKPTDALQELDEAKEFIEKLKFKMSLFL